MDCFSQRLRRHEQKSSRNNWSHHNQPASSTIVFIEHFAHQSAARCCWGGHRPDPALHLHAPMQAPDLVCTRMEMQSRFFLNGLPGIFMYFRMVSRHSVLLVSVKNQCCTRLVLVSGTSLTDFSILFLSCFVIFRLRPQCAKKVTSTSPSFTRAVIFLTVEYDHPPRGARCRWPCQHPAIRCHELTTTTPFPSNSKPLPAKKKGLNACDYGWIVVR